jgi:hypothetical protein
MRKHRLAGDRPILLGHIPPMRLPDPAATMRAVTVISGALPASALPVKARPPMSLVKPIHVGPVTIDAPVILAPMTGVTDLPFRKIVKRYGAG